MKKFLLIFLFIVPQACFCQIPVNQFNKQEKQYFKTLLQVAAFLKSRPTNTLIFHESEFYSNEEAFYDTVITKFFAKGKMLQMFEIDTSHFAVKGKLDITRHILNSSDYYLDIVPLDSILIEPYRHSIKNSLDKNNKEDNISLNSLSIFFKVGIKKIRMLVCIFDEQTNKLLSFSLLVMEKEDAAEIDLFLKRQKNYYEYPNPWVNN